MSSGLCRSSQGTCVPDDSLTAPPHRHNREVGTTLVERSSLLLAALRASTNRWTSGSSACPFRRGDASI